MDLIGFLRRDVLKEDDEWNSGARWRMGEILICLCVPLQAAHEVFAGKEVKFFSKAFENKSACCFSLRFSLSLSLSAFFLIRALLSDDEKKNHRATRFVCFFFFFFFFYSSSFPYFVGEVLLLKTTPRRGVCWSFCSLPQAYFLFVVPFGFGQSSCQSVLSFALAFSSTSTNTFLSFFSPLFIQMRKHIKVFIIS